MFLSSFIDVSEVILDVEVINIIRFFNSFYNFILKISIKKLIGGDEFMRNLKNAVLWDNSSFRYS